MIARQGPPARWQPTRGDVDAMRAQVAREMTEAVLQGRVQEVATGLGWWWYHAPDNRPGGRSRAVQRVTPGWPDLVLVRGTRILYRELKTQTGRVTPEQSALHELLFDAGADVAVWRPMDLIDGTIAADLARWAS